jgi:hypothetical protein
LPHPSVAVKVLVCVTTQLAVEVVTAPSVEVTVGVPQASVAEAVPNAALIFDAVGLHASVNVVPLAVIDGGVTSTAHDTVLEVVAVLPQASVAVNVLVCERVQEVVVILPSIEVTVGVPQASVAVAAPSAASIAELPGLHPKFCGA